MHTMFSGGGEVHAPPTDAILAGMQPLPKETSVQLDALLDGLPGTIVFRNAVLPDGTRKLIYVSASIEPLTGLRRTDVLKDVSLWYALIAPDQIQRIMAVEEEASRTMTRFREEVRYIVDGRTLTFEVTARPTRLDDGTVLWDGTATDVTELVAQREERERLAAIVRATDDMIGMIDATDGRMVFLNDAFRRFAGLAPDDDPGAVTIETNQPERVAADYRERILPAAAREGRWSGDGIVVGANGRERQVSQVVIAHPERERGAVGPDGEPLPVEHYSTIMRDITGRVAMEQRLREASERAEIALREVNHRVKNLFALVPALVQLSARGATDVPGLVSSIRDRVAALGRAHALTLNAFSEDRGVALDALIRAVLEPYEERADAFSMSGPAVRLSSRNGNAMSLALHEMATNAAKYGALATERGRVAISWRIEREAEQGDDRLVFSWKEAAGPAVTRPAGSGGFGTTLIDRLIAAQGGSIERDWNPFGLAIDIALPVYLARNGPPRLVVDDAAASDDAVATSPSIVQDNAR